MADTTQVPEEIQEEYYAPEKKEKSGVAWLLAIGTLVLTVVLATGLFFAGRWTYNQIAGDDGDSEAPVAVENQNEPTEEESPFNSSGNTDSSDDTVAQNDINNQEERRDQQQSTDDGQTNNSQDGGNSGSGSTNNGGESSDQTNTNGQNDSTPTELNSTGDDPSAAPEGAEDGTVAGDRTDNNLPETGPADTVAIFVAVTVFGYLLHRFGLLQSEQ